MTSFKKISAYCDRAIARMDELGDDAIEAMRNTPEAQARQAEFAARMKVSHKHAAARSAKAKVVSTAYAATFSIGQAVRTRQGVTGTVAAIEGMILIFEGGRKFAASACTAA